MMHENTDDKMFQDLLSDYAAPVDDNGFGARVMEGLPKRTPPKAYFVGAGAIAGGAIAARQLPALWNYIGGLKLPSVPVPAMKTEHVQSMVQNLPPSMLMAAGLVVMTVLWFAGSELLRDDI